MSTYYNENNTTYRVLCIARLKLELNNKDYFPTQYSETSPYYTYLKEVGLEPESEYDKDKHYKQMLQCVYNILDSLSNNIDLYRSVETEFATYTEAYTALEKRLTRLKQRIDSIPDQTDTQPKQESNVGFLFFTR